MPVGFLDLPLELRQMVYGYILPECRMMYCPESWSRENHDKTVAAVCATDLKINEELEDMIYKKCGARIRVTLDSEIGLPSVVEWDRFQSIDIVIGRCAGNPKRYSFAGMKELLCRIRYGRPESLPPITILFQDEAEWVDDVPSGSTYCWHDPDESDYDEDDDWAESQRHRSIEDSLAWEYDYDPDDINDTWLRQSHGCYKNPVAIEILDFFLDLPPCKYATVFYYFGLDYRQDGLPRHNPQRRIFDADYADDMCAALELWLKGDRDGIELPLGNSNFYGEPRLEQIAYQRRNGNLYCDDGLKFIEVA